MQTGTIPPPACTALAEFQYLSLIKSFGSARYHVVYGRKVRISSYIKSFVCLMGALMRQTRWTCIQPNIQTIDHSLTKHENGHHFSFCSFFAESYDFKRTNLFDSHICYNVKQCNISCCELKLRVLWCICQSC